MAGSMTAAGAALAISAAAPATADATGYAALTFTEIGLIEKIGVIGANPEKVTFKPLKGAVIKKKGSVDYGSLQPNFAYDSGDAGQTLLKTASASVNDYSFKVTYADGSIDYFRGSVFGFPKNVDAAASFVTVAPTVEINSVIVSVN